MTTTIRETLARDLDQHIEEIIKLDQQDARVVGHEISEYVATPEIVRHFRELLQAIADAPRQPEEGIGIWVSGFFGSGKSSFAKNLGYLLANREVTAPDGESVPAATLLGRKFDDERINRLIDFLQTSVPTDVIMFDVMLDRAVKRQGTDPLAEIVYTVLLRELGYAEDFDLAELEIELEREGRLDAFQAKVADIFSEEVRMPAATPQEVWRRVRKGASSINRASRALHELDPATYATPDSWLNRVMSRPADISPRIVVDRIYDLMARRRPGKGLAIVIDEIGQYVGRSHDKIEELRALVEQIGKEGRNRVTSGRAPAPTWVVVTSQEKLDEVVANLDSKRVELARLQDRFRYHVDLAPADIKIVATTRVLGKSARGQEVLAATWEDKHGQLNTFVALEQTSRAREISRDEFVQFYPYLPHFIDLSIDIVSGIRLQPGAPKQIGGSNRTIIKQAYEMLVSDRTRLADKPVGELVTLDRIYELVEGNLSTEKRRDIAEIRERFPGQPWAEKAARAIALLEFVRDLPRSDRNIAALLYPRLGEASPLAEVREALDQLVKAQFVRLTDDGYKLQTQQEKSWETERTSIEPTQKELNDLARATLRTIADDRIQPYRPGAGARSFKLDVMVDGVTLGQKGDIPIDVRLADDDDEARELRDRALLDSRHESAKDRITWVATLTPLVRDLQTQVIRSRRMVAKYDQVRAQGALNPNDQALLEQEKQRRDRTESQLASHLAQAISAGTAIFRGVSYDSSALGDSLERALSALLDKVVPQLYPRLELGAKRVATSDIEEILKAANLNALPAVYYEPPAGLGLVKADGQRRVIDEDAEIARAILGYLRQQQSYGEKVTGRMLESHFTGLGFGWDIEVVKLVLATLLRAGSIEVTHGGRRYRNHVDPLARLPFSGTQAFRSASFAPRQRVGLQELVKAAEALEGLTGVEVDVEEDAIAERLKELAELELQSLWGVEAELRANRLAEPEVISEYRTWIEAALMAPSDDCVRMLAGEGKTVRDQRDEVQNIRSELTGERIQTIIAARSALTERWPEIESRVSRIDSSIRNVVERAADRALSLDDWFARNDFFGRQGDLKAATDYLTFAWNAVYRDAHERRTRLYEAAIEHVVRQPEWRLLDVPADAPSTVAIEAESRRGRILGELRRRVCDGLEIQIDRCATCRSSLQQLESDIETVRAHRAWAIEQLKDEVRVKSSSDGSGLERVQTLRVADLAFGVLASEEDIERLLNRLRDQLAELLAAGGVVVVE